VIDALDRFFYPQYSDNWDNSVFRERILRHLRSTSIVLDLGAGSGHIPQMNFRGQAAKVCGLDPEAAVLDNEYLDVGKVGGGEAIPWPNDTFDVVFSGNVMEHLSEPEKVFAEIHRVLKPGGTFLCKTPNQFHYVALIARFTPFWFHAAFNKVRGRSESHTFPTFYRANSKAKLQRLARLAGFTSNVERIEGRPEYTRFLLLYPFGLLWERVVNRFKVLSFLRVIIIAEFFKPS